jgi:hypothetical protein
MRFPLRKSIYPFIKTREPEPATPWRIIDFQMEYFVNTDLWPHDLNRTLLILYVSVAMLLKKIRLYYSKSEIFPTSHAGEYPIEYYKVRRVCLPPPNPTYPANSIVIHNSEQGCSGRGAREGDVRQRQEEEFSVRPCKHSCSTWTFWNQNAHFFPLKKPH